MTKPSPRRVLLAPLGLSACAGARSVFDTHGPIADQLNALGVTLLAVAAAVCVIIAVILLGALFRRRDQRPGVRREGGGVSWVVVGGIVIPAVILVAIFVITLRTLSAVAPPQRAAVDVQVTGHRWWWDVVYVDSASGQLVRTANEIHIPTGKPVRITLGSVDVIHSFWVPALAGKTDLNPGQRNVMWLEARDAGTYAGQCAEYCGLQHAHMAFTIIAEPQAEFSRWLAEQARDAAISEDSDVVTGRAVFATSACALCHTVRGSNAQGRMGPDLTHVATRRWIAAGTLPNSRGNLAGWIANAQGIKPGAEMPPMPLKPAELNAVLAYLESLQ